MQRIKCRNYTQSLENYTGEIILVGVNYTKGSEDKLHSCVANAVTMYAFTIKEVEEEEKVFLNYLEQSTCLFEEVYQDEKLYDKFGFRQAAAIALSGRYIQNGKLQEAENIKKSLLRENGYRPYAYVGSSLSETGENERCKEIYPPDKGKRFDKSNNDAYFELGASF